MRLGYIVEVKPELIDKLRAEGSDLHEYFAENYILSTEGHDYEDAFEGWKRTISDCAKSTFIKDFVYGLDFADNELGEIFDDFKSDIELFNRWWTIKEADCEIIPTTWLKN